MAALALVAGGYAKLGDVDLSQSGGVVAWLIAGAVVPLAIRSPVRTTNLRGRERQVGATFIYDWVRVRLEDPLDARMSEVERSDIRDRTDKIQARGWTFEQVRREFVDHLDHRKMSQDDRLAIAGLVADTETLQPPAHLRALVRVIRDHDGGPLLARLEREGPA
jgi:hypothetical protein